MGAKFSKELERRISNNISEPRRSSAKQQNTSVPFHGSQEDLAYDSVVSKTLNDTSRETSVWSQNKQENATLNVPRDNKRRKSDVKNKQEGQRVNTRSDQKSKQSDGTAEITSLSDQSHLEVLNCLVCKEMLRIPVYMCQNGHNTCIKCLSKSENCAICHATVSDTRNTEIERMLEEAIRPCPNASKGCEAKLYPYNMEKHVALCSYSGVQCLAGWGNEEIPKCEWNGLKHELGEHVRQIHRTRGGKSLFHEGRTLEDVEMQLEKEVDYHETSLISACDELFWRHVKYDARLKNYMECLAFIGSPSAAEGFRYCHTLVTPDKGQMLTLENDVCSESDNIHLVKSGMCLSLDYDFLKKFLKDGRIYGYRLHIMFKG